MAKKNSRIDFSAFDDMLDDIDKITNNVEKPIGEALQKAAEIITEKAEPAMAAHTHGGGPHALSFLQEHPETSWDGSIGEVDVGFKVRTNGKPNTGFHSIYVMYGTPRYKGDKKLYNAFYGGAVKKMIQKEIDKYLTEYLNHIK